MYKGTTDMLCIVKMFIINMHQHCLTSASAELVSQKQLMGKDHRTLHFITETFRVEL